MDIGNFTLVRLSSEHQILPFDCGDTDLNDFLHNDAKNYTENLLAVTYLLESENSTAAFFSLLNDKVSLEDTDSNSRWRKYFRDIMPQGKRFKSYPAVKLGRLGVDNSFKGQGIGTIILDYIKGLYVNDKRAGCRYITVDAYRESLRFYEKNGFKHLTEKDKGADTRLMYFDLLLLKER